MERSIRRAAGVLVVAVGLASAWGELAHGQIQDAGIWLGAFSQGELSLTGLEHAPTRWWFDGQARFVGDIGGGALYDIGCYVVTAGRWFFEAEPERVVAAVDRDPVFMTDRNSSGVLDFGGGRHLAFTVSTQSAPYQRIQLVGTRGRIEIQIPVNAPPDKPSRYLIDNASALDGSGIRTIELPVADQYQLQAEAFSNAVRSQQPDARGLDEAIAGMRVIDALFASEKSGRFERP